MTTKEKYKAIESHIVSKLRDGLSPKLTYHTVQHTLDILKNAERIAKNEDIHNEEDLFILKVACLYHDSGFLTTYKGHEEVSCDLAKEELPKYEITKAQLKIICGLIMATKIPQTPHNKMEEIICDADLDYLGTDDYYKVSDTLFLELKTMGFVTSRKEWDTIQVDFIKNHQYFTETNKKLREKAKLAHLQKLKSMI